MAIFPIYCDLVEFLSDSAAAIETNSLIGGNATLHASYPAGSTSLVVDPVALAQTYAISGFGSGAVSVQARILDGLQCEQVTITNVNTGTSTLTLASPGTQVAHAAGTNIASAGTAGSLAKALVDASRKAETFCRQGPAGVTGITGGNATARTGGPYSIGAVSATVQSSAGLVAGAALVIDGPSSERVTLITATGSAITLASPGFANTHSSGATVVMAAGGDRNLYALPRTETYSLTSMTAHVDNDRTLVVNPYHFPVTSVQAMTLQFGTYAGNALSGTGLVFPNDGRQIMLPYVSWGSSATPSAFYPPAYLRDPNVWLQLSYTAGPIPLAFSGTPQLLLVPDDIKRGVYLYAQNYLGYRQNPLGAANIHQGDTSREYRLRGDKSSKSLLVMEAEEALQPYKRC